MGGVVGSFFAGILAEKRGRKQVLVLSSLSLWMGLGAIYFSLYIPYILIGRVISGVGIGAAFTTIPLYLEEIAENENRSFVGMFTYVFMILGTLIAHASTFILTLNELNLTFFVVAFVLTLFIDWWLPESYLWFLSQDRTQEAEDSFKRIRKLSNKEDLTIELMNTKANIATSYSNDFEFTDIFKKKHILGKLNIICGLMFFQQIIGVIMFLFYYSSLPVLDQAQDTQSKQLLIVFINVIALLSLGLPMIFINKLEKRIILLISAIGSGLSLLTLTVYFTYLNDFPYVGTASIVLFTATYSIGLGPMPFVILGEIFPLQIRTIGSAMAISFGFICNVCICTILTSLLEVVAVAVLLLIVTIICFIAALWIYFCLPGANNKDINLEEN